MTIDNLFSTLIFRVLHIVDTLPIYFRNRLRRELTTIHFLPCVWAFKIYHLIKEFPFLISLAVRYFVILLFTSISRSKIASMCRIVSVSLFLMGNVKLLLCRIHSVILMTLSVQFLCEEHFPFNEKRIVWTCTSVDNQLRYVYDVRRSRYYVSAEKC